MDPQQRHLRLQELLLHARDIPAALRSEYLDAACQEDAELRREIELLLLHDKEPLTFVDAPFGGAAERHPLRAEVERLLDPQSTAILSSSSDASLPKVIDKFSILRKLGEGGMGAVYEAQQKRPQRIVALKVLRPNMLSLDARRRFEHEIEYLGRLQHSCIAQIFESGTAETESGPKPWFAMELVRGEPLTEYANQRDLGVRERLELVASIADGVQHAHQNGVIHRDLKPQNILVDESGQPKILDFGIARAIDSDVRLTTLATDIGQILGTLAYMSPEQASGDPATIDTRSDVYSLGVLLYELLAGKLPYDISTQLLPEAVRVIQQEEPRRLSTVHTKHRGDVETIVGKALEKDKDRRYASAAALATDIRHYLNHEPISARPPSRTYTLRKFVRRNKTVVSASVLVLLSLVVGLGFSVRFGMSEAAQRVRTEEKRAEVLKLAALQDVEDLRERANELWPIHPDDIPIYRKWIDEALALEAQLPEIVESQRLLRSKALPRTEAERRIQRGSHPDHAELVRIEGEIAWRTRILAQLRDGEQAEPIAVEWGAYSEGAVGLRAAAWRRVDPGRRQYGEEALGLALALRAVELAPEQSQANALDTLAWAYFAVGRMDEALDTSYAAFESASESRAARFESALGAMEAAVSAVSADDWTGAAELELERLASRREELDQRVDERSDWTFPEEVSEGRWWNSQLTKLTEELKALRMVRIADLDAGELEGESWGMRRRLDFAEELRAGFAADGAHAQAWSEAATGIRAAYPGLNLAPQLGLVPIGPDPASGLWEFAHLLSGAVPERDDKGAISVSKEMGIVFVLLGGGSFLQGAQTSDPQGPNFDPGARSVDGPPFEAAIQPFFFSKYEMTQAQWLRFTGENPSYTDGLRRPSLLQPVEQVSWVDCMRTLERMNLTLPSESQWEYGARGGTSAVFWTGDESSSLQGAANLVDEAFILAKPQWPYADEVLPWNDGFDDPAPVGTFAPNPFGLHEIHGNVVEWCLNAPYFYSENVLSSSEGAGASAARFFRVGRGGSFRSVAAEASSAYRNNASADMSDYAVGLRPARAIDSGYEGE